MEEVLRTAAEELSGGKGGGGKKKKGKSRGTVTAYDESDGLEEGAYFVPYAIDKRWSVQSSVTRPRPEISGLWRRCSSHTAWTWMHAIPVRGVRLRRVLLIVLSLARQRRLCAHLGLQSAPGRRDPPAS